MSLKRVDQTALNAWIDGLIKQQTVYGVQAKGDRFAYDKLAAAKDLRLDYDVALQSPKKYFLPARDTIIKFQRSGQYEPVIDAAPFIVLGVHPYDVIALAQMDAVFAKDNCDVHYLSRRDKATIIACDVQTPAPNVFAASMGTATADSGFDILLTKVGDNYVVDARTEKGEALLGELSKAPNADEVILARRQQIWEDNKKLLNMHKLNCRPADLPDLLGKSMEHPVWEKRAAQCYSCGSCNLVCPTCYCFDVQDEVAWDMNSGERKRQWDGCMLQEFALVAGNHNFRKRREDRYRHRFYRKGKYLWDRMKQIACVGCGRCTTACTAKIANPVEVYNSLLEDK